MEEINFDSCIYRRSLLYFMDHEEGHLHRDISSEENNDDEMALKLFSVH